MNSAHRVAQIEPPSVADAMSHVVDAGERLISHRLELAVVELRQTLESAQRTARWALATSLLAAGGWVFFMLALLWALELVAPRALAAAIVGLLQLTLMGVAILERRRFITGGGG